MAPDYFEKVIDRIEKNMDSINEKLESVVSFMNNIDKKLDLFIIEQNHINEVNEENESYIPTEKIDWDIVKEMVCLFKENKNFYKKMKFTIKEKIIFAIIILCINLGLYVFVTPLLIKLNIPINIIKNVTP